MTQQNTPLRGIVVSSMKLIGEPMTILNARNEFAQHPLANLRLS